MHVLKIKSRSEVLLGFGILETLCAMTYPADPVRGGLLLKELVKSGTDGLTEPDANCLEVVRLDRFLWKGLGEVGRSPVREAAGPRFAQGTIAGKVLLNALRCGVHRPEHRSVGKAIFLVAELAKRSKFKDKLPMSESKILRYWRDFQSVAHLHASQILVEAMKEDWMKARKLKEQSPQFALFLAIAGRISGAAHAQFPPIGRTSKAPANDGRRLINRARTIQVQIDGVELDLHDEVQLAFLLTAMTQEELSILGHYSG